MIPSIGVDEAGRGALAGPVSVGAVLCTQDFDWRDIFSVITKRGEPKVRDSKQLSAQQRDLLFRAIESHRLLRTGHAFVDAATIDAIGIVNACREAAARAVRELGCAPESVRVLLDAGLALSSEWQQESFVHGDARIPAIALASIIAKVKRDRYMEEQGAACTVYGFELHKGYGTTLHYQALRRCGLHAMHRRTFIHLT